MNVWWVWVTTMAYFLWLSTQRIRCQGARSNELPLPSTEERGHGKALGVGVALSKQVGLLTYVFAALLQPVLKTGGGLAR